MNRTKKFEPYLHAEADFVVTKDKVRVNAGAWVIKNSEWSKSFLERWWNMKSYVISKGLTVSGDNTALNAFMANVSDADKKHIVMLPRCSINSLAAFIKASDHEKFKKTSLPESHDLESMSRKDK